MEGFTNCLNYPVKISDSSKTPYSEYSGCDIRSLTHTAVAFHRFIGCNIALVLRHKSKTKSKCSLNHLVKNSDSKALFVDSLSFFVN